MKINSSHGFPLNLSQRLSPLQSFAYERRYKPLKKNLCVFSLHGHLCHHLHDTLTSIRCSSYNAKNKDYCQHYICHQEANQISRSALHFADLNLATVSCFILILKNKISIVTRLAKNIIINVYFSHSFSLFPNFSLYFF